MRALEIDPSDQTAQQEIEITQRQDTQHSEGTPPPVVPGSPAAQLQEATKEITGLGAPIELQPVSNDPIKSLHMVEDVKVIYQAIGKAAGINVLFDPDYQSKRIPVDLTNVSLFDALRIVGTISGTFWKPVTSNTIYVMQNTRTKHTDQDDMAVQTFYLTNSASEADSQAVIAALRQILDPTAKAYLVPSQNAVVMRAPPDQILLAQKLLNDLDRPKPEVVVDIAILEVNRDKIRNLGITLPQSFGLTPTASSTTTTTTGTSTTNGTTTTNNLTLNNLAHLNATNFNVSVGAATLNALLNDTDTRVLQNPRMRATDGQIAHLKIGEKLPIATGSYNAGVSTGVASIGVQTQFPYTDVGVNIDMTPTVHLDHEVSLKMMMEVTSQTGSVTISGVTQPIIGQRHSEQTIQLKEDEPAILAGLLDQEENRTNSGTPGLAEIPFLKYLFGSQFHESKQDEIVFVMIPHIVREPVLTAANTRAIDTGTGQDIELRRDEAGPVAATPTPARSATPPATAANAASAMIGQIRDAAQPRSAVATLAGTADAPLATPQAVPPVMLSVVPQNANQPVGSTFQVAVMVSGAKDLNSVPLSVQYDPKVLALDKVDQGELLARDNQAVSMVRNDRSPGVIAITATRPFNANGVNGQGTLCILTFRAIAPGDSNIQLVKVSALNTSKASLPAVGSQAVVHVK